MGTQNLLAEWGIGYFTNQTTILDVMIMGQKSDPSIEPITKCNCSDPCFVRNYIVVNSWLNSYFVWLRSGIWLCHRLDIFEEPIRTNYKFTYTCQAEFRRIRRFVGSCARDSFCIFYRHLSGWRSAHRFSQLPRKWIESYQPYGCPPSQYKPMHKTCIMKTKADWFVSSSLSFFVLRILLPCFIDPHAVDKCIR